MNLIDLTILETISGHNWDFYRDNYIQGKYSYADLVEINELWYPLLRRQVFFHPVWARRFFKQFNGKKLNVIELGCYQGELAEEIMARFPTKIGKWVGSDICESALYNAVVSDPFEPMFLDEPFYKQQLDGFDVFISTHTLEHMIWPEVFQVFDKVNQSNIDSVFLELPVKENGKKWRGGGSSHVLDKGRKHIRGWFLDKKWKVDWECVKGMDWCISIRR